MRFGGSVMRYSVHGFGVKYAEFNQQQDAEEWALAQSVKYQSGWFEVHDSHGIYIAYQAGEQKYGDQ